MSATFPNNNITPLPKRQAAKKYLNELQERNSVTLHEMVDELFPTWVNLSSEYEHDRRQYDTFLEDTRTVMVKLRDWDERVGSPRYSDATTVPEIYAEVTGDDRALRYPLL